jgi:O-antigen biosynthesis protein WbqP
MKRSFDLILASILFMPLLVLMFFIAIAIIFTSKGPPLHWSNRVGANNRIFKMPKFRTMNIDTPEVATHLLSNPDNFLTPIGGFLRKSSLDELPQLFSIIKGHMSFVGPRPALFNQNDLIKLRSDYNLDKLVPGLTGWAQINGRDELSIPEKVTMELEYMENKSFWFDLKIIWMTILKVLKNSGVSH